MPTYAYKCECGKSRDVVKPLALLNRFEFCQCGEAMQRQLSAPRVMGDYAAYNCPVTGKLIEGRKAHAENLARHGCRVLETGEKEEAAHRRRRDDEHLDAAVEATTEEFVHKLPIAKREQLAVEIAAGADAAVTRI